MVSQGQPAGMPTRICQCLLRTEWREESGGKRVEGREWREESGEKRVEGREWREERKESREKSEKRRLEECRQCAVE